MKIDIRPNKKEPFKKTKQVVKNGNDNIEFTVYTSKKGESGKIDLKVIKPGNGRQRAR